MAARFWRIAALAAGLLVPAGLQGSGRPDLGGIRSRMKNRLQANRKARLETLQSQPGPALHRADDGSILLFASRVKEEKAPPSGAAPAAPPATPAPPARILRWDQPCPPRDTSRMGAPENGYRTLEGSAWWVKGYRPGPGAQLQGADLSHGDLRGLDLTGASLEGADLSFARCEGACFQGARMFSANIRGTSGLEASGAQRHPFFQAGEGDTVGTCAFLDLGDGAGPRVEGIALGPDGTLLWIEPGRPGAQAFTPQGCRETLDNLDPQGNPSPRPLLALALDAEGGLWLFDDWHFSRLAPAGGPRALEAGAPSVYLEGAPEHVHGASTGEIYLVQGTNLHQFTRAKNRAERRKLPGLETLAPFQALAGMTVEPHGPLLACISGRSLLFLLPHLSLPARTPRTPAIILKVPLPKHCQPRSLVCHPDGRLLLTDPGRHAIVQVHMPQIAEPGGPKNTLTAAQARKHLDALRVSTTPLPGPAGEPHAIRVDSHGTAWFTETQGDRVGGLHADGTLETWPLPPGTRPRDIIGFRDGTLLFTCQGSRRVGAFRYAPPPPAAAAVPAGPPVPEPEPAPAPPPSPARALPDLPPTPRTRAPEASQPPEREERKAPRKPRQRKRPDPAAPPTHPEGPAAAAVLAAHGLGFPSRAARHILTEHGPIRHRKNASVWDAARSSWSRLEQLFAEALLQRGGLSRTFDPDGHRITILEASEPIGTWPSQDGPAPTRRFRLVTGPTWSRHGGPPEVVISAFPVP